MLNSRTEIEPYVPHSGAMLLLDRVIEYDPEYIVAEVDIDTDFPGCENGRVPAYFGIEVMAQSIAAWAGIRRGNPDSRPPIGFLLGSRRFECELAFFPVGSMLTIHARRLLENDGLGVFQCDLDQTNVGCAQTKVATAVLNVYSPPENPD